MLQPAPMDNEAPSMHRPLSGDMPATPSDGANTSGGFSQTSWKGQDGIHLGSLILNALVFVLFIVMCAGVEYGVYIFFVFYVIYLGVGTCGSATFGYVRNINTGESAFARVEQMKQTPPSVWMKVHCWHMEYVNERVRKLRGGQEYWENETREKKVYTREEKVNFAFDAWKNTTFEDYGLQPGVLEAEIVRMEVTKSYTFADSNTRAMYQQQSSNLRSAAATWDHMHDFTEGMDIAGYEPHMLCMAQPHNKPWWINAWFYILCLVLMMCWPYQMALDRRSLKKSIHIQKEVQSFGSPQPPAIVIVTPPLGVVAGGVTLTAPSVGVSIGGGVGGVAGGVSGGVSMGGGVRIGGGGSVRLNVH